MLNKTCSAWLTASLLLSISAFSQSIVSEMPIIREGGILKSRRVIVSFKENILPVPRGTHIVDLHRYPIQHEGVRRIIQNLSQTYGTPKIRKTMPHLVWGDTLVRSVITGHLRSAPDMSQEFAIDFPVPIPLRSTLQAFRALSVVKYAEQPIQVLFFRDPNDDRYRSGEQWYLAKIQAPRAWDITIGSEAIEIAIIDKSGEYDARTHPDLSGKFVYHDDRQSDPHFIAVSGVAGANTDNTIGIASLSWNTKLQGYHFNIGTLEDSTRLPGLIERAMQLRAKIINFSFTTLKHRGDEHLLSCPDTYRSVAEAIRRVAAADIVLVAAAGHYIEGCDFPYRPYPAGYEDVIGVSGTNQNDEFAHPDYNYGSFVDIAAPARDILTTHFNGDYSIWHGTSFASPLVCGLAALIRNVRPDWEAGEVEGCITATAQDLGPPGWDDHFGYGRINAYKALSMANGTPNAPSLSVSIVWEYGVSYPRLSWTSPAPDIEKYEIWRRLTGTGLPGTLEKIHTIVRDQNGTLPTFYVDRTLPMAGSGVYTAKYQVKAVDAADLVSDFSNEVSVQYGDMYKMSVLAPGVVAELKLHQNYPNPFNPSTTLSYVLPEVGWTRLTVYDVLGREVAVLVNGVQQAGVHQVIFDASPLPSGVYYHRLQHNGRTLVGKMMLTR